MELVENWRIKHRETRFEQVLCLLMNCTARRWNMNGFSGAFLIPQAA